MKKGIARGELVEVANTVKKNRPAGVVRKNGQLPALSTGAEYVKERGTKESMVKTPPRGGRHLCDSNKKTDTWVGLTRVGRRIAV